MSLTPGPPAGMGAVIEEFEPRLLYAADLAWAAGAGASLASAAEHGLHEQGGTLVQWHAAQQPAHSLSPSLAVVDERLADVAPLLADLHAHHLGRPLPVLVRVGADDDGLSMVAQALQGRHELASLHLWCHGIDGVPSLGRTRLDNATLIARAGEVAHWSHACVPGAELLVHANLRELTGGGQPAVQALSALTGADVQARELPVAAATALKVAPSVAPSTPRTIQVNLPSDSVQTLASLARGSSQAVSASAAGRFVVVWTSDGQDGSGKGVYARLFGLDGQSLTGEIAVDTRPAGAQTYAGVAMADDGSFVVTWSSDGADGAGWGVYARRFDIDGHPLGDPIGVNANRDGDQLASVVAINRSTGAFAVAWQGAGADGVEGIWLRRYSASGTALDAADVRVSAVDLLSESSPSVAMSAAGHLVVAWEASGGIYHLRYGTDGAPAAQGVVRVDAAPSRAFGPSVAIDAQGNYALAYADALAPTGVVLRGYGADGSDRFAPVQVATGDVASVSLAMGPNGQMRVTWQALGSTGTDIFSRGYDSTGAATGPVLPADPSAGPGAQRYASAAVLDASHQVIVWSGPSGDETDAILARIDSLDARAPVIVSDGGGDEAAIVLRENATLVTQVRAEDANLPAQTLVYSLDPASPDAQHFSIDAGTGDLRFVQAPNHEAPVDAGEDNVYQVTVQVHDGDSASLDTQALTVTVGDVPDDVQASGDSYQLLSGSSLAVDLVANDVGSAGGNLRVMDLELPAGLGIVWNPVSQSTTLVAAGSSAGTYAFSYLADDGTRDLRHYWWLDEAALGMEVNGVTTAYDEVNGAEATYVGALPASGTAAVGQWGLSLDLTETGNALLLPDIDYGSGFSLSFWVKLPTAGIATESIFSHGTPGSAHSIEVSVSGDSVDVAPADRRTLSVRVMDGDDVAGTALITGSIADWFGDNQWHQVMVTVASGVGTSVYVDGAADPLGRSSAGGGLVNPSGDAVLGHAAAGPNLREFSGLVDSLAVWGHALDAAERQVAFDGGTAVGEVTVRVDGQPAPTAQPDTYVLDEDSSITAEQIRAGWQAVGWVSRQAVTVSNTSGTPITDTPVMITLDSSKLPYEQLQAGGADLRFFTAGGSTPLAYDIEQWNPAGTSIVWVRMPSIIAGGSTPLWMYYGNSVASAGSDATATWGAEAAAIVHLGTSLADDSANGNPVTATSTPAAAGLLSYASDFNGTTSSVRLGTGSSVNDLFVGGGTISAWIQVDSAGGGGYGRIADKANLALGTIGWALQMGGTGRLLFEASWAGFAGDWTTPASSIPTGTGDWVHVVVTLSTGSTPTIYINGQAVALVANPSSNGTATSDEAYPLTLGNRSNATDRGFDGRIDEFRAYTRILSAAEVSSAYAAGRNATATVSAAVQRLGVLANHGTSGLHAVLSRGPAHASSFTLFADGAFQYQPTADFSGTDSFSYRVTDGTLDSPIVTVTLQVQPKPDAPVFTS